VFQFVLWLREIYSWKIVLFAYQKNVTGKEISQTFEREVGRNPTFWERT